MMMFVHSATARRISGALWISSILVLSGCSGDSVHTVDSGYPADGDAAGDVNDEGERDAEVDAETDADRDAEVDAETDADEELCHPGDGPCMVPMGDGVRLWTRVNLPEEVPLEPGESTLLTIEMYDVIHQMGEGSQLVVFLMGGFCGYAENPHTGHPLAAQMRWDSNTWTILHEESGTSRIVLPLGAR